MGEWNTDVNIDSTTDHRTKNDRAGPVTQASRTRKRKAREDDLRHEDTNINTIVNDQRPVHGCFDDSRKEVTSMALGGSRGRPTKLGLRTIVGYRAHEALE